jgi:hypothetical protein
MEVSLDSIPETAETTNTQRYREDLWLGQEDSNLRMAKIQQAGGGVTKPLTGFDYEGHPHTRPPLIYSAVLRDRVSYALLKYQRSGVRAFGRNFRSLHRIHAAHYPVQSH